LVGYNEEEGFYYFPYAIIAFSVIPQLIWLHDKEKILIVCSLIYYLVLVFMADNLLTMFAEEEFRTSIIITDFYVYYKIAPIAIFLFLHFAIYYLRHLNYIYEKEIMEYNTELNATIKELKTTQQHLIQAEKMASLGTLTAGVAHEINNPLNFIVGGIEMNNDIREEIQEYMSDELIDRCDEANKLVYEGFERVSGIVKALMSFSYAGEPRLIESDIHEVIDDTLLFLGSKMPEDLIVEKKYQFEDKIPIYRDKMHQVIINIINNAIDAVKENKGKKKITISTGKEDGCLIIEISNNGPKIPENHINQIFDPFFTTKDPGKGIGLGLSICYSFISEHNGTIEVKNMDKGITFIIKIPLTNN
jgi:C4-dicarboxylate-specific signal transduction histidine kinase